MTESKIHQREKSNPEKRKKATPRQVSEILKRQSGICALCPEVLVAYTEEGPRILKPFDVDHVTALAFLGGQGVDNLQCLCQPCHKNKTRTDNREAKKGRRIRGELKPKFKRSIPSAPFKSGRGFDKGLMKRTVSGKVVRRDR